MALQYADRVKQVTSNTSGTVTLTLSSTVPTGFKSFASGIGGGNTCHYCLEDADGAAWEVGVGTVTDAALDTLSRDTVLASSNGTTRIDLTVGTHTVFCTYPAQAAYNSNPLYQAPAISAGSLTIDLRSASDSVHRVTLNQNIVAGGITLANPPSGLARVHIQFDQATPGGTTYDVPATAWPVNMTFVTPYLVYDDATPTVIRAVTLDGGTNYVAENNYEPADYQPLATPLSQLSTLSGSGVLSISAGSLSTATAGTVGGPAVTTASQMALFSGTNGNLTFLSGTGYVTASSGVIATIDAATLKTGLALNAVANADQLPRQADAPVAISASTTLTSATHGGKNIYCYNSAAITLSITSGTAGQNLQCLVIMSNTATVSIASIGNELINSSSATVASISARWKSAYIHKYASNASWVDAG